VETSLLESLRGLTVADVMLTAPKTLPPDTSVAVAREALADDHVQILLLGDGRDFRGAVTAIPERADAAAPALGYADAGAETIAPTETAEAGYERARRTPTRRVIVLDRGGQLVGLLCLKRSLSGFCTSGCRSGERS
jgi:CBS domain-containing protein